VTRLACTLALVAVAIPAVLALQPVGWSAILLCFVGMPSLAAAIGVYLVKRWREGAFSGNH
jgi:hypothetical protein